MGRWLTGTLFAAGLLGILTARAELLEKRKSATVPPGLLYFPNGRYLKVASLGQAPLLADLYYLWAIQYYSDYTREDRFRYVEHVFGEVITELDPHYVDPYWLGALILSVEARDLDAALRLLDLGFARNPEQWVLPYLAGWECYRGGQFARAADYFARAARAPGAPGLVRRMRAGMFARAGEGEEALRAWTEILDDPSSDPASRAIAERQVRRIQVLLDIERIDGAVEAFRRQRGRFPSRLDDLVQGGVLPGVPLDPDGFPYAYDRATGRVSSPAARVLGER